MGTEQEASGEVLSHKRTRLLYCPDLRVGRGILIGFLSIMGLGKDLLVFEYDRPKSVIALPQALLCLLDGDSHVDF